VSLLAHLAVGLDDFGGRKRAALDRTEDRERPFQRVGLGLKAGEIAAAGADVAPGDGAVDQLGAAGCYGFQNPGFVAVESHDANTFSMAR